MDIKEKIEQTKLFPQNIKRFLLESHSRGELDDNIIKELNQMFFEEEKAMNDIEATKTAEIDKVVNE